MYNGTAEQLYTSLESSRWNYLDRARDCSRLTIPYIMPEEGFGSHSRLNTPFQGVGARGTNNLASKLLLALLPPNAPFFRFKVDERALKDEGAPPELLTEIEQTLREVEDHIMDEIAKDSYRVGLHEALKHLIITGNVLLYMPEEGGLRVFHLDRFVVKRDPMGNVLQIATKEDIAYSALPQNVIDVIGNHDKGDDETCSLYTAVCREGDRWHIWQDINGVMIPDSEGYLKLDESPFIPLRWSTVHGSDYGRGYVEEYLGDLQSLEALTKAIVEGSAAAAKVLFMINPNGTTRPRTLSEAPNGAIVQGNQQDVSVLQLNKFNDFRVAQETIAQIKERLAHSFLITSGQVRNAERVTAEEIRMLSQELEAALGGLYSLLSSEMQLPMIKRLIYILNKTNKLPKLPEKLVEPVVVTGIEALGRGNDLQKLDMFLAGATQIVGPEALASFLNVGEYFTRRATALGIKTDGLMKSQEEMQMEQQQAQQMQMMQQLGPAGINAVSKNADTAQKLNAEAEQQSE